MSHRKGLLTIASALCLYGAVQQTVTAQPVPTARQEEALIRQELERIIAEDPAEAASARKALDALNQPETSTQGRQARNRRERGARRIVNGLPALASPAVGALLKGNDRRTAKAWCTGTLVGCDKFLTAAHCIEKDPSEKSYLVFFQDLGFFEIQKIDWEPTHYKVPFFDIAMLTLKRPVEGIAPISINTTTKPLNKSIGTVVGFGRTGGSSYDYGIKREGSIRLDSCSSDLANSKVLCWRFDADVKAGRSQSNSCNGDSGGGVFLPDLESGKTVQKLFGVVSFGKDENCVKDDESYNVDVFQYRDWIQTAGEGRLTSRMCGHPLWQSKAQEPSRIFLDIGNSKPDPVQRIDIPANATSLRVALNGDDDDNGKNDFDLLVHRGGEPVQATPVCAETGTGQFAFCDIKAPGPGPWTALVKRKKGTGKAQLTIGIAAPGN